MWYLCTQNYRELINFADLVIANKFLTRSHTKIIKFYTGIAEILEGDMFEAQTMLTSVITSGGDPLRKAMAYNNFGISCWWNRYPNYVPFYTERDKYSAQEGEEDSEDEPATKK